jgi:hypothetical protein
MPERERDGEASSRPSMSDRERDRDRGGDREQGPIPLFDLHLRFLSDSYLAFFNERSVFTRFDSICSYTIAQKEDRRGIVRIPRPTPPRTPSLLYM